VSFLDLAGVIGGKVLHFVVALLFAGAGGEGVGDMHREHGLVKSCKGCVSMLSEQYVQAYAYSSAHELSLLRFCSVCLRDPGYVPCCPVVSTTLLGMMDLS
jgi:hypothetical protein